MSEGIFNDDLQVDPRLDALLSRALGHGALPRQQRQRHLERLGLAPRLGGSAGMWRAPVVVGRPPSSTAPQPVAPPIRRRHRQWLELGAAALAVLLVGTLLVALFRDWNADEDDSQLAASPEATATHHVTREQLYVVSHTETRGQDVIRTAGRVSAIDPRTGEEFWSVEAGPRIDSALSPDGQRLFVADSGQDGDHLYALDTQTGRELWRVAIQQRQWHKPGSGESMLSVSPDGATVSVYSCEGCTGEIRSNTGRNWLQRFDAVTGAYLTNLDITECRGVAWQAPDGSAIRPIYVICDQSRRLEIINPENGQGVNLTYDVRLEGGFPETTGINASATSPDGRLLYLASGNRLTVVDLTRQAATRVQLDTGINVDARLPLLTLSADGSRIFIGSLDASAYDRGTAEVNRVDVYDTATWLSLGQITTGSPLTGAAFAASAEGTAAYGVFTSHPMTDETVVESTIQRLTFGSEPATIATRPNEEVLYLFAGTVEVDPDAEPRPTPTPGPTAHERLFAVSSFTESSEGVAGRVTAYDAVNGELVYRIDTGQNPDAILSPDGTLLFVAATSEDGDTLSSYDALSGDRNWSVPIEHRVMWHDGAGPTRLAVSQDGSRLFVYSASAPGDYTIQVFDTADGRLGRVIDGVAGCTAQLFPSADGRTLYVVCLAERFAPQVIDLEAWTSAGVMQGFGGIISGAAASLDGRYLYIPQDIDTEMSLSVIDMNGRVIADMRSIIHLASDPLHALNITAVSPDGSHLFIGVGSQPEGEAPIANEVWVWDLATMRGDAIRLHAPEPINGWSLAPGPGNNSVFAVHNEDGLDAGGQPSQEAVIMRLSTDGGSEEFVRYWGGDILRIFSGRVIDAPEPPKTVESDADLLDKMTIPRLPLGLTLLNHTSSPDEAELILTDDEGHVIEVDVRRWTAGEQVDPPDRSTPVHLGSLTVHVVADPDGGWPRLALWHDPRFVYSLSVLESPPDGWTQDNLLAVVTAFSSPVNASVCPAVTWTGPESRNFGGLPEAYWIDGDGLALGRAEGRLKEGENEIAWIAGPSQKLVDPAVGMSLRGTRLRTGYERSVPLEVRDQAMAQTEPMGDAGVRRYLRSTVIFPTYGCWQIEAEFGTGRIRAVVNVEPDYEIRNQALSWGVLRWRPLHEMPSESSSACVRTGSEQIVSDFGPVVGDVNANAGPAYMNGVSGDGAMSIPEIPAEDGGYYARVMFITGGDYTGPLLVRVATGSEPIAFSLDPPGMEPASEWHLEDPAGTSPTAGVRHWIVYLRFDGPGCHALQIDGLDFTSVIAFETVPDARFNPAEAPAWDGAIYALSGNDDSQGVVELDPMTGAVRRQIDMIPYGNSYPHLEVSPEADRLAVAGSLPGEEMRLDVLIYRLSDFTLLQRVPVPTLIQAFSVGDGIALSPDGRFLYAYQYEAPPDGNGNNARYWLGTYDLDAQMWLADVDLPYCGPVTRMDVRSSPYVYVQCSQTGLLNVDTSTGTVEPIAGQQTASFQHHGNKALLLTTGGTFYSGASWAVNDVEEPHQFDIPSGWTVAPLPFHVSGGFTFAYVPIQPSDGHDPTEIVVIDLNTNTVTRTIQTSAPFREIVFSGDEQFAYVTLVGPDQFTTGIARIDLATGVETTLAASFYGNLVAVSNVGSQ